VGGGGRGGGGAPTPPLAVLFGFAIGALAWERHRAGPPIATPVVALAAVVLLAAAVAGGYPAQRSYLEHRYADILDGFHLDGPIAWANDLSGARVATAGRGGVFFQYGFYGRDISNYVQWVGAEGEYGAWLPLRRCPEWREAVNDGGYDYVVTTYDERTPGTDGSSTEREWIRDDPAAREVYFEAPVAIYALRGPLDPRGCPANAPVAFRSGSA
jgi:hypothetical protein